LPLLVLLRSCRCLSCCHPAGICCCRCLCSCRCRCLSCRHPAGICCCRCCVATIANRTQSQSKSGLSVGLQPHEKLTPKGVPRSAEGRSEAQRAKRQNYCLRFRNCPCSSTIHPKNKFQKRGKFPDPKNPPLRTTFPPQNHHNFTTKNHPKSLWKSQTPLQKRHSPTPEKIIPPSNIFSNQTTAAPYSAPTP
jgi:hypothetical protein